ncbi:uncharacterized protein A1O5_09002 [Cladophialophora psammophila CBS 110553]|uniref:Uncharacterized protein n=1 Tax=Cladophialophora psammophila CBS 110553 TaxID=1182543 RepID=W9WSL9_9EURO|nr:uncharacterized protein A1O5_09002 [Cladophialophora psammophila CBS 110553]EXJ67656.1 hypothetical protein A1O5_09002 [Cladophialophora psammophila CBS 110553]
MVAGSKIDGKKLKRQVKANARQEYTILDSTSRRVDHQSQVFGRFLPFGNKMLFLNWNIPLAASGDIWSQSPKYTPPFGFPVSTPDGGVVRTPSATGGSPTQITSLHDKPSPLSAAVSEAIALDRTHLFLHGRFDDLAKTLNSTEKATMSSWLYQFWLFALVTSKHWGQEPRTWTRYNLAFDTYEGLCRPPSAASPTLFIDWSSDVGVHEESPEIQRPSQRCRWSIHIDEEAHEVEFDADFSNPNTERPPASPLEEQLENALENNDFSNIAADKLPLAMSQIVKAVKRSPNELLLESLSFSIMARNIPLLEEMLKQVNARAIDVKPVYPLHIATSYFDGGSTCCLILETLCSRLRRPNTFYTNDYGHTVLDNLMMTILKGHSSSSPDILDDTLTQDSRFAGIEVDLCGRWDADSPYFRVLLQSGKAQVPLKWKHKFCHTSILAVCHCIDALRACGLLGQSSGHFAKRCFGCGLSLQLSPFHVLVLTAFQLARSGCEGEDLLGMIAVLLCMLANKMDPQTRTAVSIDLLLGIDDGTRCTHEDLRAIDLAERLPSTDGWSAELQRGWHIFCHILRPVESAGTRLCETKLLYEDFMLDSTLDSLDDINQGSPSHDSGSSREHGVFPSECSAECSEF